MVTAVAAESSSVAERAGRIAGRLIFLAVIPVFIIAWIYWLSGRSRPQPMPVLLLVVATTITSIAVLSNYKGMGNLCGVLTIILLVPLVLSKWLFRARTE